jgi:hypothetical protein
MYQQNPRPTTNSIDQAIDEISRSKIWNTFINIIKTLLKIGLAIFIAVASLFCILTALIVLGLGGSILAFVATFWQLFAPLPAYLENTPQLTPFTIAPVVAHAPDLNPTHQPVATFTPFPTWEILPTSSAGDTTWRTVNIELYGYQVDLPEGWLLEEEKLPFSSDACNLGHDLANYKIFNLDGSEIEVQFLCWARDDDDPSCPGETIVLDENRRIVRSKISDGEYQYGGFDRSGTPGLLYCIDGWPIADQGNGMTVNEIADYKQTRGEINLEVVDRIVLSVHQP